MKRVIIVALQQYLNNGHEPRQSGALCRNWREVRELLRNDYKDCEVTIFRQKWSLPYKDFWVKSAKKEVAIYLKRNHRKKDESKRVESKEPMLGDILFNEVRGHIIREN